MNRTRILAFAVFMLIVLGCSDSARADVALTVAPQALTFSNVPSNSLSPAQQVQVTANQTTTVIVQVSQSSPWLTVSPTSSNIGTTATSFNVRANTQGLATGSYTGFFTISVSANIQATVSVGLTVSGTSILSATPASVTFAALQGAQSGVPASTTVQIASSGATLKYNLAAQTTDGHNWLLLNSISGTTGDAGFAVSVNPSTLAAGSYTGSITAMSTTTGDTVQISVALTVNSNATLTVSPAAPAPFLYQTGSPVPAPQQLTVSASGGTGQVNVQFSVRQNPSTAWLVVSPLTGSAGATPATINLNVTPNGLLPGSYTTNVVVTPNGGADLPAVPVTLVVSANPLLQLSTNSLSYSALFASGQVPPDQQVTVTASNNGTVGFSFSSDQPWLTATQSSSSTPSTLTVHVNSSGLTVGNFTGNITVKPTNGDPYSENIAVSVAVSAISQLTAGPADLLFSYQAGQVASPAAQTVQIQSSGQPVPFTLTTATTNCGANWLTVVSNASTTPATLTISVATVGMSPGVCSGTVTVNNNSGSGQKLPILVTVAVSNSSELVVSLPAGFGVESVAQGAAPFTIPIPLTSTDPNTPVPFSANTSSVPGTWLGIAGNTSGTTPQNLSIQILPGSLLPGQYSGTVTINSTSLGTTQLMIPITLTVTSNVIVTLTPTSLSFTEAQGGPATTSGLPAQTLVFASSGGNATPSFNAGITSITGGNWLQIGPTSGQATGGIQVNVQPNSLSQGDYTAQILVTFQGAATASIAVPVVLHVTAPQTLNVPATPLSFTYQVGGPQPASQPIAITSTGGGAGVAFSVGTTSSGWLAVDATSGTTPKTINVSVNTQGLQAGSYTGSITVSSPGVLANAVTISVTLTVTVSPPPAPLRIYNAASGVAGVISPGEIITITGSQLGPASPAGGISFQVNSNQTVNSTLGGVQVLFDNNPGTPTFVSASQINVVVPYEIAGRVSTNVVVTYNGVQSAPIQERLADAAPGLFTDNESGTGQVAAINQNGTLNGPPGNGFTPAAQGSELQIYGTGGGQTNPPSVTGTITPIPASPAGLLHVPGTVTATVGGVPATVDFAGSAPNLITGAIQFNVHLPTGVTGNSVPIVIIINGVSSPLGTTVAIQ